MQVNGEKVRTYMHTDLVTVLKRCAKGNQATFALLRQPQEVINEGGQFYILWGSIDNHRW